MTEPIAHTGAWAVAIIMIVVLGFVPGLIMAAIYLSLLAEIERDGYKVLSQRTSLTPVRKFWLAWKTWMSGSPPAIA